MGLMSIWMAGGGGWGQRSRASRGWKVLLMRWAGTEPVFRRVFRISDRQQLDLCFLVLAARSPCSSGVLWFHWKGVCWIYPLSPAEVALLIETSETKELHSGHEGGISLWSSKIRWVGCLKWPFPELWWDQVSPSPTAGCSPVCPLRHELCHLKCMPTSVYLFYQGRSEENLQPRVLSSFIRALTS